MPDENNPEDVAAEGPDEVRGRRFPISALFHYVKSPHFRTVHVDGCFGGLTPAGYVHCAIYSERPAIPRVIEIEMDNEHNLTDNFHVHKGRVGYTRELEVELYIDIRTARSLADWLSEQVEKAEAMRQPAQEPGK